MSRCARMVRQATELLCSAAAMEPSSPVEAAELARAFARAEKVAAAAAVRMARTTPDPGGLLSAASGTAAGAARRRLQAAQAAAANPGLEDAVRTGQVSLDQAGVLAAVDAGDARQLLAEAAAGISMAELKAKAARLVRSRRSEQDEVAREWALHARRYCRFYERDGGVAVDAFLAGADAARFMSALRKKTDQVFRAAGADEPVERYRADALVTLVAGGRVASKILVRVDAAALARDALCDGEVCEIDGIGEVSLATVRGLLPDAVVTALVRAGSDVRTISSGTRVIPRRIEMALTERDRCCVVPGCGRSDRLEIDHWATDFSAGGMTELANLCRLCPPHHRMKTRQGYRLAGGPGEWRWLPPLRR